MPFKTGITLFMVYVNHIVHSHAASVRQHISRCIPTTGEWWETLAPLGDGVRQEHAAAAIGKNIYVVGGLKPVGDPPTGAISTGSMEVYDVDSNTWSDAAPLPVAMNHPNIAAAHGKVYILGGLSDAVNGSFYSLPNTYEYDPATDHWSELPSLPEGTGRGSSIVGVHGDDIILAGGVQRIEASLDGVSDTVDIVSAFNIRSQTWRTLPPLPEAREHTGGAVVRDKLYVVGGRISTRQNVRGTVYALCLKSLEWKELAPMPTPRGGISVAAIKGKIYTFGGEGNLDPASGDVFNETEVYDVKADCWEKLSPMDLPRHGFAAVTVGDKIFTPGGGIRDYQTVDTLQAFHPGSHVAL